MVLLWDGSSRSTGEVQRFRSWESPLYQLVKTGLKMFDVSSPVKLQDYLTYLAYQMDSAGLLRRKEEKIPGVIMQETSKPGLLRRKEEKTPGVIMQETSKPVQESPSVKHFRETLDDKQLREFVTAHVKEGTWQVVMLFWDKLLQIDSKDDDEDTVSGDLKSRKLTWWPTDEDHDLTILLKVLTKGKRKLTDEGAKHIAEALTIGYWYPHWLDLSSNNVTDEGIKHIAEALSSSHCLLKSLHLSWNEVTDEGVKYIAEALSSSHCRLESLDLDWNKVTDEGVKYIAEALSSSHCRLESLDLHGNKVTDEGVKYIAEALSSSHCRLENLYLDGNKVTDEGVKHIADALSNAYCRLNYLILSRNDNITDKGLRLLAEALMHSNYQLEADRPFIAVTAKVRSRMSEEGLS